MGAGLARDLFQTNEGTAIQGVEAIPGPEFSVWPTRTVVNPGVVGEGGWRVLSGR
jgi:hypothetical protein